MRRRVRASGLHFIVSLTIAILSGLVVFCLWYPPPYGTFAGGLTLFTMLVSIDIVLGPVLTALVASPAKPNAELRRDIAVIALVQLLAFVYGMYSIAMARPVHLVFEKDRFCVVSVADIDPVQLSQASTAYRELSWTGPTLIAARESVTEEEKSRSLDLAIQGRDISMQPDRWVAYGPQAEAVLKKARPVKLLLDKYPQVAESIRAIAINHNVANEHIYFLPLQSRQDSGVVLVAEPDARIIGYLLVDGFF